MIATYILKSLKDFGYYIGSTRNLEDRIARHFNGRSRATRGRLPLILVYKKEFDNYNDAYQLELWLKKQKSKKFIERFINCSTNNNTSEPI